MNFIDEGLNRAITKIKKTGQLETVIFTRSRRSEITQDMVGLKMAIYDGRKYRSLDITENMIGEKLGSFIRTKIYPRHTPVSKRTGKHLLDKGLDKSENKSPDAAKIPTAGPAK